MRLIDLIREGFNDRTKKELCSVKTLPVAIAVRALDRCIEGMKINDRTIRIERRTAMSNVLKVLYTYLLESEACQVSPSMRTIAFRVNEELEEPNMLLDSTSTVKAKEKAIHATVMSVQRAVSTLQQLNIITVHQYYSNDSHEASDKLACFFYQLTPLSKFAVQYANTTLDKNYKPTSAVKKQERRVNKYKTPTPTNYHKVSHKVTKEMLKERARIKKIQEMRKQRRAELVVERKNKKIVDQILAREAVEFEISSAKYAKARAIEAKKLAAEREAAFQKRLKKDPTAIRNPFHVILSKPPTKTDKKELRTLLNSSMKERKNSYEAMENKSEIA